MAGMGAAESVPIYLYEPHPAVRWALAQRLARTPGLELVGVGQTPTQASRQIRLLRPRVVVVGLRPGEGALPPWIQAAARGGAGPGIVALDTSYDEARCRQVESMPGSIYLLKGLDWELLVEQIKSAQLSGQEE